MATPTFIKALSRNSTLRRLTSLLGYLYIRLIHVSGHWQIKNQAIPDKLIKEGKSFITCFWHGRLLMMSFAWPYDSHFYMLISTHPDGQLIAQITERLGFKVLESKARTGGSATMRSMVRTLNKGGYIGITPDGPRGPRMRSSSGAIALAKLSGAPILPLSYSSSRWKMLKSWDHFILPMPFAKGVFIWGEPIEISQESTLVELEAGRKKLEEQLTKLTKNADDLFGLPTPEPAAGEIIR